ncbi:RNA-directed DNA polymerase [Phytophthora palmivora]|uniref:RNA-directed DNA polymerase n=1 Tax=Phytophthora palmivora TaxID=4796 RepID=A0A2P4WWB6_9STRA|nr:RNA-directed DNA polymerase [Phytophthora palmivora]
MFPPLSETGAPAVVAKALMRMKKGCHPNAENHCAVWTSTVVVLDGTDQASNIGRQVAEAGEESAESAFGVAWVTMFYAGQEDQHEVGGIVELPVWITKYHTRRLRLHRHGRSKISIMSALLNLEELSMKDFLVVLKAGEIAEMVLLKPEISPEDLNSSFLMDKDVLEMFTKQRATRLGSEILRNTEDPVYPLVNAFSDVVSKHPPSQTPPDRGCEITDAFFAEKAKSGMVRESKSPHSTPTFCVQKPNGMWRLVHAYNKLNNATCPGSGRWYYQILMRESDIPLTAVSTPSGMLWEWLVMPQGLSNAPATFNRLVTQLFRPLRTFAQTYFDDIFDHSRTEGGQTATEVHLKHLRRVFDAMRASKLNANIDKCVFARNHSI